MNNEEFIRSKYVFDLSLQDLFKLRTFICVAAVNRGIYQITADLSNFSAENCGPYSHHNQILIIVVSHRGGYLGEDWGDGLPQNLRWEGRPMHWSPNI